VRGNVGKPHTPYESSKCVARFWKVFPHLTLCGSLVLYATLGALVFQHIEGGSPSRTESDYQMFLGQLVHTVQNHSSNSFTHEGIVEEVKNEMKNFKSVWFQGPHRWDFFGSMFFCCTVFTTVGKRVKVFLIFVSEQSVTE
uniref:Potassium channel, subfamily K, member 18 n=1 Tax=Nothobranchius furzeri TaxID=105023 RepID=A0A8C6KEJ1_NOTFU